MTDILKRALISCNPDIIPDILDKPKDDNTTVDYAIWRFLRAWKDSGLLGPDQAVLFRQIVRWKNSVFLNDLPADLTKYFKSISVNKRLSGELMAEPFIPNWLNDDNIDKKKGLDYQPEKRRPDESVLAEPYLNELGHKKWMSLAQKEAAWAVLKASPRSTTLISLPTGAGKSTCFYLLPYFCRSSLTLVIVPTIALAIDQYISSKKMLPDANPQYYCSDNGESVARLIENGQTRLVFASPESCVSGRLKRVLSESARKGVLGNLVIDEAHIVHTWGAGFRVDFQLLSSLQRKWTESSDSALRTFLFSATIGQDCYTLLKQLFDHAGTWQEFMCQRLRPEITYYVSRQFQNIQSRYDALMECMWCLPRPNIFYTTKREHAEELYRRFHDSGFRRIGCFHGDTPNKERRRLLEQWRADKLDTMVATSAFGLGVDKDDIRAVVHACLPEDMNRYYQEVGRSGRDGASSLSILMVAAEDFEVARSLTEKMMTPKMVQKRWEALHREGKKISDFCWELPIGAQHHGLLGTRSGRLNKEWNEKLLLQLQRAGKLDIEDVRFEKSEEDKNDEEADCWVSVKIQFSASSRSVGAMIEKERGREVDSMRKGLDAMHEYLQLDKCISRHLKKVYGPETQKVCGGCSACRKNGIAFDGCPPLEFDSQQKTYPTYGFVPDFPNPFQENGLREFKAMIIALKISSIRNSIRFICDEQYFERIVNVLKKCDFYNYGPYRFDFVSKKNTFLISPSEILICLHFERLSKELLMLELGKSVIHCATTGVNYNDVNGRFPREGEGAKRYMNFDSLLKEI